jgi:hyperosmotically inducible periplasmic protein
MSEKKSIVRPALWVLFILVVAVGGSLLWARGSGSVTGAVSAMREASVDAATAAKVKTALALSKQVSAFDLDIDSEDRVVTLRGQVPSPEVADLAVAIAGETAGVEQVRDELVVDPAAEGDPEIARMASRVADLELKAAIQEAILRDPAIRDTEIAVAVEDGQVRLTGRAPTPEERYQAELVARRVTGVEALDNGIVVPEAPVDPQRDQRLADSVEFALYSSRAFDLDAIEIQARDGQVALSGQVRSRAEALLAERVAAEVEGVAAVNSSLRVAEPATEPAPAEAGPTRR